MSGVVATMPGGGPEVRGRSEALHRVLSTVASLLVAALVLKVVLDAAYLTLMRDFFSADPTIDAGPMRIVLSYALTALAAVAVSLDVALRPGPGNVVSLLYLCLVIVPLLTLFGLGAPYSDTGFVVTVVGCAAIVVAVRHAVPAVRPPAPGPVLRALLVGGLLAMSSYVYGALIATGGLQRMNFDLELVYAFREELALADFPLANYLIPWQAYVVNMAVLAHCAYRRRWALALMVLAAQLLLFGMTNHKSFLFAPALVLGVLWLARSPLRVAWGIAAGGAFVVLAAWALFALTEQIMIPSIFVRRLFFVPGELHLWYHDFFSSPGNPFVMLSNSVLAAASPYPYPDTVPVLIGWTYAGVEIGANAGWMADAYAQFGAGGMVAFSVILAVFLRILDGVSAGVPRRLATAIVAVPAMALVNSGLLTVLLTHGFLLGVLVLWLLSNRQGGET